MISLVQLKTILNIVLAFYWREILLNVTRNYFDDAIITDKIKYNEAELSNVSKFTIQNSDSKCILIARGVKIVCSHNFRDVDGV